MTYKFGDHVKAAVDLKYTPPEWPWIVEKGREGWVRGIVDGGLVEVHFESGPIVCCKASEIEPRDAKKIAAAPAPKGELLPPPKKVS